MQGFLNTLLRKCMHNWTGFISHFSILFSFQSHGLWKTDTRSCLSQLFFRYFAIVMCNNIGITAETRKTRRCQFFPKTVALSFFDKIHKTYLKKCLNFWRTKKGYTQRYEFGFKGITFLDDLKLQINNNTMYSFACDFSKWYKGKMT